MWRNSISARHGASPAHGASVARSPHRLCGSSACPRARHPTSVPLGPRQIHHPRLSAYPPAAQNQQVTRVSNRIPNIGRGQAAPAACPRRHDTHAAPRRDERAGDRGRDSSPSARPCIFSMKIENSSRNIHSSRSKGRNLEFEISLVVVVVVYHTCSTEFQRTSPA